MRSDRYGSGRLLRWYPPVWRDRYGPEFLALLDDLAGDEPLSVRRRASIACAGLRQRVRSTGLFGDSAPLSTRRKTSGLVVLVAWALFTLAGSAFAKLSEHADRAVSGSARATVNIAYRFVELFAAAGGAAVIVAALICVPAFATFVRAGGWSTVRRYFALAASVTAVAAGGGIALVVWAHGLSASTRETGAWPYGAVFVVWALTVAAAVVAWAATAVVVTQRVRIKDETLRSAAVLSRVVVIAMLVMTAACAAWWAAVASRAPQFLGGPVRMTTVMAAMVVADAIAMAGAARGARTEHEQA